MSPKYMAGPINSRLNARFMPHMGNSDPCKHAYRPLLWLCSRFYFVQLVMLWSFCATSQWTAEEQGMNSRDVVSSFWTGCTGITKFKVWQNSKMCPYLGDCEYCIHISLSPLLGLDHLGWCIIVRDVQPQPCNTSRLSKCTAEAQAQSIHCELSVMALGSIEVVATLAMLTYRERRLLELLPAC